MPPTHFIYFDEIRATVLGPRTTRKHVAEMVARGEFPAPRQLSARRIAWRRSEVTAWVASRPPATAWAGSSAEAA
jgi:predicted DNA-binding transcriptional regulator AlpA